MWYSLFQTKIGWFGLKWSTSGLVRLTFGHGTKRQCSDQLSLEQAQTDNHSTEYSQLSEQLQAYTEGVAVDFADTTLDLRTMTPFRLRATKACRKVPYGQKISYAELARRAGSPQAARAAGNVMSQNPIAIIVPCHRIIGSANSLGGFSAPDGINMKRRLLEMEAGEPIFT